jgi:S1-C subfamily serine protease
MSLPAGMHGNVYPQTSRPSSGGGGGDNTPITKNTFIQLAQKVTPAVVNVLNMREVGIWGTKAKGGHGSGFIIDSKKGIVLTNNHVVAGAKSLAVALNDKRAFKAKLLGTDPIFDVAVVQIENPPADLKQVALGNSDKVQIGEWIVAMGFPGSMGYVVTAGNIIAIGKEAVTNQIQARNIEYRGAYMMIDAVINPGNSGGPLFNLNGEVVGINTVGVREGGALTAYGGSIPINTAIDIKDRILKDGRIIRAYFGLDGSDIEEGLALSYSQSLEGFIKDLGLKDAKGIFMYGAVPGSPAQEIGFQEGDVLVEFDGKKIENLNDFRVAIAKQKPGQTVKLKYIHRGESVEKSVTLQELGGGRKPGGNQPSNEPCPEEDGEE